MFEADVFFDNPPKESGWIVTNELLGEEKAKMCVDSVLKAVYGQRPFERSPLSSTRTISGGTGTLRRKIGSTSGQHTAILYSRRHR